MTLERLLCKLDCNKRDVPILRGRIHFICLIFYPYAIKSLSSTNLPQELRSSLLIFLISNILTLVSSTLLHNNQKYIYRSAYKRIDIASVFITTSSITLPLDVYYIKEDSLMALIIYLQWILTFMGVFGSLVFDFCCISKEIRAAITFIINAPKFYLMNKVLKSKEYQIFVPLFVSLTILVLATLIYCKEESNVLPGIIGHHELFHIFMSMGFGIIVYIHTQAITKFVDYDRLVTNF